MQEVLLLFQLQLGLLLRLLFLAHSLCLCEGLQLPSRVPPFLRAAEGVGVRGSGVKSSVPEKPVSDLLIETLGTEKL